jgi:HEAT repeat protein
VKSGLGHSSWQVRAAAAEAAGRIGLLSLALLLRALLGDTQWLVRYRAGEALARLGTIGAALLRETATCAQEPARTAAALTLAEREIA